MLAIHNMLDVHTKLEHILNKNFSASCGGFSLNFKAICAQNNKFGFWF
jgi:hypothetical protein